MNEIKISYVIGVHNEPSTYIQPLLESLLKHKDQVDEIIIVDDYSDNQETASVLERYRDKVKIVQHNLNGDFASHKNFMIEQCTGQYIFNIDADEMISPTLLQVIKEILFNNPDVDLYYLPRINIVHGITPEDVAKYRWYMSPVGYINWPDQQGRIFKNDPAIRWSGKVHERITGTIKHTELPYTNDDGVPVTDYAILHVKTIERQRQQNELYASIQ